MNSGGRSALSTKLGSRSCYDHGDQSVSTLEKATRGLALNPYIGCEHGCYHCYCPAMPGVKFANRGHSQRDWGTYLFPKPGLISALCDQLRRFPPDQAKRTEWGDGWILMSFLTDCYTPSEAKYRLTRRCLELLLEAGHKVRVQTRSALAERDFDLFAAHRDRVLFGTSLPHLDDTLARALEPRAAGPTRRLRMLERAANADIPV
jgi:DNA repair photolyase